MRSNLQELRLLIQHSASWKDKGEPSSGEEDHAGLFAPSPGCVDSSSKGATAVLSQLGYLRRGSEGNTQRVCDEVQSARSLLRPLAHGLTPDSLVCHDFHPAWPGLPRTFWASQLDRGVAMETLWSICCPDCEEGQSPVS